MKTRYQDCKIADKLVSGGWPKTLAKNFAGKINKKEFIENADDNEFDRVKYFAITDKSAPATMEVIEKQLVIMKDIIDDKKISAATTLTAKSKWPGCMTKLITGSMADAGFADLGLKCAFGDVEGSEPWLVALRTFSWCWGPGHWPLPGVAAMIHALDEVLMYIITSDVLLSQGIGLDDAKAFFDTKSGCACFQKEKVIRLAAGESVWVPAGHIPLLATLGDDATPSKKSLQMLCHVLSWCGQCISQRTWRSWTPRT